MVWRDIIVQRGTEYLRPDLAIHDFHEDSHRSTSGRAFLIHHIVCTIINGKQCFSSLWHRHSLPLLDGQTLARIVDGITEFRPDTDLYVRVRSSVYKTLMHKST